MSEQFEDFEMNPALALDPSTSNPAVLRCCEAWASTYRAVLATGKSRSTAHIEARDAYSRTLPLLTSPENIRDFIACVAHGYVLGAYVDTTYAKLLYSAQVAHSAQAGLYTRRKPVA